MYAAVVPARNEAGRIGKVIAGLLLLPFNAIIPVINGCVDSTLQEILHIKDQRVMPIYFREPLGIDIPRAIGACYALYLGCQGSIFVDGDMTGNFQPHLGELLKALEQGIDLALVNCYPYITNRQKLTNMVLYFRGRLNRELGLFKDLGLASPTHGPHGISRKLLETIDLPSVAVPPMVLAQAKKNRLTIKVVTSIPHDLLSSPVRERGHAHKVAHTIIGDCLQALSFAKCDDVSRAYGKHLFNGYHSQRRFDLLAEFEQILHGNNQQYLSTHILT
ncbi:MAG TPA: glycosyltransferase family 2 protein [Desulfobacteria bacterium]|nr:glycosyltransferase family 2 protein [Desulfobacteria bacterium]